MKKVLSIVMVVLMLLGSVTLFTGCGGESQRNKEGSSIDWGKGHYWDSNSESVQENPLTK